LGLKKIDCDDHEGILEGGLRVKDLGKIVVFPTDTVYGLGTNPRIESAVNSCFELKERDDTKPFPLLFSEISTVGKFVELNQIAESLARKFWPGGLTLVLKAKPGLTLSQKLLKNNTLAVRIPNHSCCLELIRACGGSLIGTSANKSGEAPFTDPNDTRLETFASTCDYFIRGQCFGKVSSTVVSIESRDKIKIIREGAVPALKIRRYLEKTKIAAFS
jgi:L-threonylcarbamoyladenylate synthase